MGRCVIIADAHQALGKLDQRPRERACGGDGLAAVSQKVAFRPA
jgi:hypothetical protein